MRLKDSLNPRGVVTHFKHCYSLFLKCLVLHFINTLTFRAGAGGHSMLCPYRSVRRLEMEGHGMPCPKFPIVHLASKYT